MRKISVALLFVLIPLYVFGFHASHRNQVFSANHEIGTKLIDFAQLTPPPSKNRSWRLAHSNFVYDTVIFTDYDIIADHCIDDADYYYDTEYPENIDSVFISYSSTYYGNYARYTTIDYDTSSAYVNSIKTYISGLDSFMVSKTDGFYDAQNRLTSQFYYNRTDDATFQTPSSRTHFIYNDEGYLQSIIYAYGITPEGAILTYSKELYEHDANGRISTIYELSSPDSVNWTTGYDRFLLTYHVNDALTGQQYIENLAKSFNFTIPFYPYSTLPLRGMITQEMKQYGSALNNQWSDSFRWVSTYNWRNQLSYTINSGINSTNNSWENIYKDLYSYNSNCDYNLYQYKNQGYTDGVLTGSINTATFTWENTTANEDEMTTPASLNLKAYPNPFVNNLNVSFQSKSNALIETSIYNLKGQLVKSLGFNKTGSITWDGKDEEGRAVSNGIYFIKAKQNGQSVTHKIIRMKN